MLRSSLWRVAATVASTSSQPSSSSPPPPLPVARAYRPQPFSEDKFLSIQHRGIANVERMRADIHVRVAALAERVQQLRSVNHLRPDVLPPRESSDVLQIQQDIGDAMRGQGQVLSDELIYHALHHSLRCGAVVEALEVWLVPHILGEARGPPFPLVLVEDLIHALHQHVAAVLPESSYQLGFCGQWMSAPSPMEELYARAIALAEDEAHVAAAASRGATRTSFSDGVYVHTLMETIYQPVWRAAEAMQLLFAAVSPLRELLDDEELNGHDDEDEHRNWLKERSAEELLIPRAEAQTEAIRRTLLACSDVMAFGIPTEAAAALANNNNNADDVPYGDGVLLQSLRTLLRLYMAFAQCAAESKNQELLRELIVFFCAGFFTTEGTATTTTTTTSTVVQLSEEAWSSCFVSDAAKTLAVEMLRRFAADFLAQIYYGRSSMVSDVEVGALYHTQRVVGAARELRHRLARDGASQSSSSSSAHASVDESHVAAALMMELSSWHQHVARVRAADADVWRAAYTCTRSYLLSMRNTSSSSSVDPTEAAIFVAAAHSDRGFLAKMVSRNNNNNNNVSDGAGLSAEELAELEERVELQSILLCEAPTSSSSSSSTLVAGSWRRCLPRMQRCVEDARSSSSAEKGHTHTGLVSRLQQLSLSMVERVAVDVACRQRQLIGACHISTNTDAAAAEAVRDDEGAAPTTTTATTESSPTETMMVDDDEHGEAELYGALDASMDEMEEIITSSAPRTNSAVHASSVECTQRVLLRDEDEKNQGLVECHGQLVHYAVNEVADLLHALEAMCASSTPDEELRMEVIVPPIAWTMMAVLLGGLAEGAAPNTTTTSSASSEVLKMMWRRIATAVAADSSPPRGNCHGVLLLILARNQRWTEVRTLLQSWGCCPKTPEDPSSSSSEARAEDGGALNAAAIDPIVFAEVFRRARNAGEASVCALLRPQREALFF